MNEVLHVYLAGPDVFLPDAMQVGARKKVMLETVNCIGHFPMDIEIPDFTFDQSTGYKISAATEALMDGCDVILVNMTPWHGPSMDVGTAFEAGYMRGRSKYESNKVLIIGYYEGEWEPNFTQRVIDMYYKGNITFNENVGIYTDERGNILENFNLIENLMIPGAIRSTGGVIFDSFEKAVQSIPVLWAKKFERELC